MRQKIFWLRRIKISLLVSEANVSLLIKQTGGEADMRPLINTRMSIAIVVKLQKEPWLIS